MRDMISMVTVLFLAVAAAGQDAQPPQAAAVLDPAEMQQKMEAQQRVMEEQNKKMQAEIEKRQDEQAEILKKISPQDYERFEKQRRQRRKMRKILDDFRAGRLEEGEAKRELLPLLRDDTDSYVKSLDQLILRAEARVAALKKQRDDPDALLDQRADALLGKGMDPMTQASMPLTGAPLPNAQIPEAQ